MKNTPLRTLFFFYATVITATVITLATFPLNGQETLATSPTSDLYADMEADILDYLNDEAERDFLMDGEASSDFNFEEMTPLAIDPESIINLLGDIGVLEAMKSDAFSAVPAINEQSWLDRALLGNQLGMSRYKRVRGFDIFYDQMSKGFFTKHSPALSSFINLTDETLLDRIQCCLKNINLLFPTAATTLDVAKIMGLFKDIAFQQRTLGLFLYQTWRFDKIWVRFKMPFLYKVNNFFLTPEERRAIALEFGNATAKEEAELRKKYFISDKLGFGDSRIEFEAPSITSGDVRLNLGSYVTLPTAFTVAKGLMGSSFEKPSTLPSLKLFDSLSKLANEFAQNPANTLPQEKAFELLRNFVLDGFNRIASNILDTPLGNRGHVGIGLFAHSDIPMSSFIHSRRVHDIHMLSKLSVEYLFPAYEKRFYISKNRMQPLPENYFDNPDKDPVKAAHDFKLIQEELINRFFLAAYETRVQPGIIFHWTNTWYHQGRWWGWHAGIDTWVQSKDKLSHLCIPSCKDVIPSHLIDKTKSQPFSAYRGRLYGGINYRITNPTNILNFSLSLDSTVFNSGIGKDFVLLFKIESHY